MASYAVTEFQGLNLNYDSINNTVVIDGESISVFVVSISKERPSQPQRRMPIDYEFVGKQNANEKCFILGCCDEMDFFLSVENIINSNVNSSSNFRIDFVALINDAIKYFKNNPNADFKRYNGTLYDATRGKVGSVACIKYKDPNGNIDASALTAYLKYFDNRQYRQMILNGNNSSLSTRTFPLQKIFYGAPGTGKSFSIRERIAEHMYGTKDDVDKVDMEADYIFRTTFHPDYDYAQFVGCYKPTKTKGRINHIVLDYTSLVGKFKEYLSVQPVNITKACVLFGYDFHDSIVNIQSDGLSHTVSGLLDDAYKSGTTYVSSIYAGMSAYETSSNISNDGDITYEFIPQVFINALVKAYENINAANNSQQTSTSKEESEIPVEEIPEKENETEANSMSVQPVYLVIEEINRGNCAQIFGDIFQLLDRDANGVSEYSISVDRDLREYLENNCPNAICNGKIKLPANLSIIATMNTSDQSLFPMDSAFKRRWEWEYVKIENNTNFDIEVDATHKYNWKDFQKAVNVIIREKTHSEDKQMGDYFIKKNVSLNEFVNKVMFYLWNDVCKENYHTEDNFFRTKDVNTEQEIEFSFGEMIDDKENKIIGFMNYLGVENQFKSVNQNNGAVASNSLVTNGSADQTNVNTEGSLNPE